MVKSNPVSDGDSVICGMSATSPAWSPVRSQISMRQFDMFMIVARVPLQRPHLGSMFCRRMIGHPTLRRSSAIGRPEALSMCKNSTGML